ncbi:aldehyde ferredoxin oxidoreductase family protein [Pyrococcus horikoshii]|nr:aldehyde ferredoxin oxidoreductase family protein [Pyrococcus horikoshii]
MERLINMFGYAGKILFIDLSNHIINTIPTEKYAKDFLGGRGIATKIAYDIIPPDANAFDPENALIMMTGPLTGIAPSSSRIDVVSLSPLTNLLGGSSAGGDFGAALKFAGYDGIVITGKSKEPTCIRIIDDEITFHDAEACWEYDVYDTVDCVKKLGREDVQVACIGKAGANLVKTAGISFSKRNLAARGGLGAVMGSKNLKAIAVAGTKGVKIKDTNKLMKVNFEIQRRIKESPSFKKYENWHANISLSLLKARRPYFGDYEEEFWEEAEEAAKNAKKFFEEKASLRPSSCFSCPLRCWAWVEYKGEEAPMVACQGTFPAIIFILKIKDPELAWKVYLKLQREGMDIMSTVAIIAYASRLGLVKLGSEDVLNLIDKIINREGPGNILAEGIKRASEHFGVPAVYVKGGMESWSSDIRPFRGVALAGAVSESGSISRAIHGFPASSYYTKPEKAKKVAKEIVGDESAAEPTNYKGKAKLVAYFENEHIIADSLGVCDTPMLSVPLELWAESFTAATGIEMSPEKLHFYAEKIRTLERMFNVRRGVNREKDTLSPRLFESVIHSGPWKGVKLDREKFEEMKDEYYMLRGWNENGIPTEETLKKYGLEW